MHKACKPDVILSWPDNCDYPLWREFIKTNRFRFGKVIIGFTKANHKLNFTDFVVASMIDDDITFFNSPTPTAGQDWRDLTVNKALQFVTSEWVWFTEQDFYTITPFWHEVANFMQGFDAIGVYQGDRLHPCSLFVRNDVIKKTSEYFGIVPNKLDHFGVFANDLKNLNVSIAKISNGCYLHYNGLSSNFSLLSDGKQPNYEPDKFTDYIEKCLKADVPISQDFKSVACNLLPHEFAVKNDYSTSPLPYPNVPLSRLESEK